jgi:hypothetical protein
MKSTDILPAAAAAGFIALCGLISASVASIEADIKSCNAGKAAACTELLEISGTHDFDGRVTNPAFTKPLAKRIEAERLAKEQQDKIAAERKAAAAVPAAPAKPEIDIERVSYQGQLMTDWQVGKVLGEIKCGKRPAQEGMDLLNVNGVPAALLENLTPEVRDGYSGVVNGWNGCA